MDERDLCFSDITTLGRLYRQRTVSPVEATRAALNRIRQHDGRLNAFITVLEDSALVQARQAEAELSEGLDRGPLHGVPLSLKDLFDTAGVRTTAASRLWRDRIPDQSATAARRLADAGAVLLGKCNLLEFAYGSVHPDFGQCNNPWDTARTSGGSSSGSAASVAMGLGWASLGTDTGGSIRVPAAYCGVVGLKPTYGRVSVHGVAPLSWSLDHVGPLTRTVEDAALILAAVAGHDPLDPTSASEPVSDYHRALNESVRGLRLGVLEEHMTGDELRPGVAEATLAAIAELEKAGVHASTVNVPGLAEAKADAALLTLVLPEARVVHEEELRLRPEAYAAETRRQLEQGALTPTADYLRAQRYRRQLRAEFIQAFEQVDVIVSPTMPWEAPREDPAVTGGEGMAEARRTAPYNLTGLPAITVPCGFGPAGLPLGLQIVAPPMAEALLLRVAHAYERRTDWHTQHPPGF